MAVPFNVDMNGINLWEFLYGARKSRLVDILEKTLSGLTVYGILLVIGCGAHVKDRTGPRLVVYLGHCT